MVFGEPLPPPPPPDMLSGVSRSEAQLPQEMYALFALWLPCGLRQCHHGHPTVANLDGDLARALQNSSPGGRNENPQLTDLTAVES